MFADISKHEERLPLGKCRHVHLALCHLDMAMSIWKGGLAMPHRLCDTLGHSWDPTTFAGWFSCGRDNCSTIALCPVCLGYCRVDVLVVLCSLHSTYDFSLGLFPLYNADILAPAAQVSPVQESLW